MALKNTKTEHATYAERKNSVAVDGLPSGVNSNNNSAAGDAGGGREKNMHSFNGSGGTSFNFNSDFSGLLIIRTASGEIQVPAMDVVELVADYVSRRKIELLEQATAQEILGIGPPFTEELARRIAEM